MELTEAFLKCRAVSTPLLAVTTSDNIALLRRLVGVLEDKEELAIFCWDSSRGLAPLTEPAEIALGKLLSNPADPNDFSIPPEALRDAAVMLKVAEKFPDRALLFVMNAHRWLEDAVTAQAVWNLRDVYKQSGATLILLGSHFNLPAELSQDVFLLDEPLPADAQLGEILLEQYAMVRQSGIELPDPEEETRRQAIEALRGLAAFPAEEAVANAMTKSGVSLSRLWERKVSVINQAKGLEIHLGGEGFDQLGGVAAFRSHIERLFSPASPVPISLVVWLEEIEKAMGGSSGPVSDNTGVSQDFLGVLLHVMEEEGWTGLIAVGPPGCAKSACAKAAGASHGKPTIRIDLGGMKNSLLGESESTIRQAMKILKGIGGKGCFWIATSNGIGEIKPELKRRFKLGTWYFSLPTAEEREQIWQIQLARYGLHPHQDRPDDTNWSGAEIRNCAELAWRMSLSVAEAGLSIVPVAVQDPEMIQRLESAADDRWLSASHPGCYRKARAPKEEARAGRRLAL